MASEQDSMRQKLLMELSEKIWKQKKELDEQLEDLKTEKEHIEAEKRKIEEKNTKLWEQSVAIHQQKEIIEKQKEKIVDSITYAQRIQQSILLEEEEIQKHFPDCFIYYQPKDIVSGDFYWFAQIQDKIIIAAIDCTGHGVPGAFMSMIGNTLLNQIVNEKGVTIPADILKHLNQGIYQALRQGKEGPLSLDGMDMALCSIDFKNAEIQFAGAQNPLYIVTGNEVEIIKGDIYGIGGGGFLSKKFDLTKREYTNHTIPVKKEMSIYLLTDGYMDQFGGDDERSFGRQKFKELLLSSQHLTMREQKTFFESAHIEWKGSFPQLDDILIIGIRF